MPKNHNGYVGVYEFARQTDWSLSRIYQEIYLRKLPAKKISRKWQIPVAELESRKAKAPAHD